MSSSDIEGMKQTQKLLWSEKKIPIKKCKKEKMKYDN